jgi:zinc protease
MRAFLTVLSGLMLSVGMAKAETPKVKIPHQIEQLPNGLVVRYHIDRSLPLAVANVSFSVGSRNEETGHLHAVAPSEAAPRPVKQGKTGFAHLFEHLMFMGTERAPTKMFDRWMESAGGWNNAWTSEDRTDYFDVAPSGALPLLLWLEADRMRDVGRLMTEAKLNAQRDVVKNERRQSYENRPYGKADLMLSELLYPETHPYHHPVIGSHTDLESASVADVQSFFSTYYDPANASLVVAGDFEMEETRKLIWRYFANVLTHGKPVDASRAAATTVIPSSVTKTVTDDVELARVTLAWTSPAHFTQGDADLDLLAQVLGDGKASRLYRKLVVEQKVAQSVSAHQSSGVLGSHFEVEIMVKPGATFEKVEAAAQRVLLEVAESAPTSEELQRATAQYVSGFVKRLESVKERASILNAYYAETGHADYAEDDLKRYTSATSAGLKATLSAMLKTPRVSLRVSPAATESNEPKRPSGANNKKEAQ